MRVELTALRFNTPLQKAYKKRSRKVMLPYSDMEGKVGAALPPVLYHGTIRYLAEHWRKHGITNLSLSVTGSVNWAASYATYEQMPYGSYLSLCNEQARVITVTRRKAASEGLLPEFERLEQNEIVNTVLFFDRNRLLSLKSKRLGIFADEDGMLLEWSRRGENDFIPSNTLFAGLELNSLTGENNLRVYDRRLWDENFSVAPPELRNLAWPLPSMLYLAILLFEGRIGQYIIDRLGVE